MLETRYQRLKKTRYGFLILLLSCVVGTFWSYSVVYSAADNFTVSTLIGSDTQPPSIPSGLTATPVAISQIDLSWATSTDDFILSGYYVWRDNVKIATTTAITYSDTGLTASTTYSYYVTAFDAFFNTSASSSVVATTTLRIPQVTATSSEIVSGTITGSKAHPFQDELISLEILPERNSVVIRYETENHVRAVIRWGKSSSYELGSLAENIFATNHESRISGLIPGMRYQFVIEGENKWGKYGVIHTGTFVTLPPEDTFPPGNVTNLSATRQGSDIVLSWINPEDPDFSKVRIVRSDLFYPNDPIDGWVAYEGRGTSMRDTDSTSSGETVYYTVFSYDALGNISSGMVVSVYLGTDSILPKKDDINPSLNEIALQFSDIFFGQEGEYASSENGQVFIDGTKQFTVAIPYERLPEHLKTILVTIGEGEDSARTFTFLLRVNKEKTHYMGTVAPFGTSGNFPIRVGVFDFKTAQIGYTDGTIISRIKIQPGAETSGIAGFLQGIQRSYIAFLIILMIALMFFGRRILHPQY